MPSDPLRFLLRSYFLPHQNVIMTSRVQLGLEEYPVHQGESLPEGDPAPRRNLTIHILKIRIN